MKQFNAAAALLPIRLCSELLVMPDKIRDSAEEIRMRCGQNLTVLSGEREVTVGNGVAVTKSDLETVLEKATCGSVHSAETSIANGFVSVAGGIRVGLCGTAVLKSDKVCGMRSLSSVALRIPHELKGCADEQFEAIAAPDVSDTLIISPPGFGKTTCMRDYIRRLSDSGRRVAVADERGELASVYEGEPQFDIGRGSDVISGAPKAAAAMMLIRSMNPQILAMDEISAPEDVRAIAEAAGCGVKILATAHAESVKDLRRRPIYRDLLNLSIFRYALIIGKEDGQRIYRLEELQK